MVTTTEQFWAADDVSLATYAWNIETWGDTRQSPPPLRGDDVLIPYRPGRRWVAKQVDSKEIVLRMWVIGSDEDGNVEVDQEQEFYRNWTLLKRLLWRPRAQFKLTRRWFEDGELQVASAQAQFADGLEPGMTGKTRAEFSVTLMLADPFFYGEPIPNHNLRLPVRPVSYVRRLGDQESSRVVVTFAGPLYSPVLTNAAKHMVAYDGVIPEGSTVTLDVDEWAATLDDGVTKSKVLGKIVSTNPSTLFTLGPFEDEVSLSTASDLASTGQVNFSVQPTWS
jgi:hypothetical protein